MAAVVKIEDKIIKSIPEQIEEERVKPATEVELNSVVAELKQARIAKAGLQGQYDAAKALFETQNGLLISALKSAKEREAELSNKVRYLALLAHQETKRKKFAGDKVTIKNFTDTARKYDTAKVIEWAEINASILIMKVLDTPAFEALLDSRGKIEFKGEIIAESTQAIDPRAQISKEL